MTPIADASVVAGTDSSDIVSSSTLAADEVAEEGNESDSSWTDDDDSESEYGNGSEYENGFTSDNDHAGYATDSDGEYHSIDNFELNDSVSAQPLIFFRRKLYSNDEPNLFLDTRSN